MNASKHLVDGSTRGACSRRQFLAAGTGALLAPSLAGRPTDASRSVTFVNLYGGNDALNTLVPTRLEHYHRLRPDLSLGADAGASLDGGAYATRDYVLHPALPSIARLYREGQVALVRLVGYPGTSFSHNGAADVWSRGAVRTPAPPTPDSGWIQRYKDRYARPASSVVALGLHGQLDFNGGETPSTFELGRRRTVASSIDGDYPANDRHRHRVVQDLAHAPRAHFRLTQAAQALLGAYDKERRDNGNAWNFRPRYPESGLGLVLDQCALLQLQHAQDPAKIFYTSLPTGLFDTHGNQGRVDGPHAQGLAELDQALNVYIEELRTMGRWDATAIVVLSEFGRRNRQNGSGDGAGTDHGEAGLMLVLGGAIRGGLFGPDLRVEHLQRDNLPVEVDFRSVYWELLERHLGVDPAPVFSETFRRDALGLFG